jgi:hypothetical protein
MLPASHTHHYAQKLFLTIGQLLRLVSDDASGPGRSCLLDIAQITAALPPPAG